MPCYQSTNLPSGITTTGRTSYATEADCLQACKEGACCEGTTCSIKPQCQCQGTGKVFKGVGTTCEPNPCDTSCKPCNGGTSPSKASVTAVVSQVTAYPTSPLSAATLQQYLEGTYVLNKTETGSNSFILYTFGGWPTRQGARYADMLYGCNGVAFTQTPLAQGSTAVLIYESGGVRLDVFWYAISQGSVVGNVCDGSVSSFVAGINLGRDTIGLASVSVS